MHISTAYQTICISLYHNVAFLWIVTFLITYSIRRLNSSGGRPSPYFRTSLISKSSNISVWTWKFATALSTVVLPVLSVYWKFGNVTMPHIFFLLYQYRRLDWSLDVYCIHLTFLQDLFHQGKSHWMLIILAWIPPGNLPLLVLSKI